MAALESSGGALVRVRLYVCVANVYVLTMDFNMTHPFSNYLVLCVCKIVKTRVKMSIT